MSEFSGHVIFEFRSLCSGANDHEDVWPVLCHLAGQYIHAGTGPGMIHRHSRGRVGSLTRVQARQSSAQDLAQNLAAGRSASPSNATRSCAKTFTPETALPQGQETGVPSGQSGGHGMHGGQTYAVGQQGQPAEAVTVTM